MVSALKSAGYDTRAPQLPGQDNIKNAQFLQTYIQSLGLKSPPYLACFSMGGLSCDYLIKTLGQQVQAFAAIDSPMYGEQIACILSTSLGGQMCPTSPFLKALLTGQDVPANVPVLTVQNHAVTTCGDANKCGAVPFDASGVDGTSCTMEINEAHFSVITDPSVFSAIEAFFANPTTCTSPAYSITRPIK